MVAVPLIATYSANGAYTWTPPAGVTSVTVTCTGGGGGGGGVGTTSGANGGGGGGGGIGVEPSVAVTPGTAYPVTVGAGGAGGTSAVSSVAGGDTSFAGDTLTVTGHGGQRGTQGTTGAGQGGAGGIGSTNTVSAAGGAGDDGTVSTNGGGGGGAAGATASTGFTGNAGNGSTAGAASAGTWPGGAGGAGATTGAGGSNGSGPGGGGGGALSTGTAQAGGNGADGQVVITWTMNDPVTLPNAFPGATVKFQAPLGVTSVKAEAWGAGAGGYNIAVTSGPGAGAGRVGCTTGLFGGATSYVQSANTFDQAVGVPMGLTAQKMYLGSRSKAGVSQQYAGPSQSDKGLMNNGCLLCLCFTPAVGGGDASAMSTCLTNYKTYAAAAGAPVPKVCFYPEVNGYQTITAAQFLSVYVSYYATANALGMHVVYNAAGYKGVSSISSYKPNPSFYDEFAVDYYCAGAYGNVQPGATPKVSLDGANGVGALADTDGKPFGLWEFGNTSVTINGVTTVPTATVFAGYMSYLQTYFTGRLTAGKNNAELMWWANGPNDAVPITPSLVKTFYNALNAAQPNPLGGAGGGGGEYAAEASLAISSPAGTSLYAITVGAGGADQVSGGNTTIAGSSVTVTAHGGQAPTIQSAGGAGGTGSGNTTHNSGGAGGTGGGANNAGGGGGGSGGSAAAGNAGSAGAGAVAGAGGAAVTGGGPGGAGGGVGKVGSAPTAGPGGGGGGSGAGSTTDGAGSDGQITLSNFSTGLAVSGNFALAPLALSGQALVGAGGGFALAPLALSGTGAVGGFTFIQGGSMSAGTGNTTLGITASTAGTLLVACVISNGTTAFTAPAGWVLAKAQAGGGANGRAEVWYYASNPGGITSATFTGNGTTDGMRGIIGEFSTPMNTTQALDGTPGGASGTAATSFPVSTGSSSAVGDLGIALFEDQFSVSTSTTWTDPAGWTLLRKQATAISNAWSSYYQTGLNSGTQSVTGVIGTSTNEVGWAGALAVYKTNTLVTSSGSLALAPLALSAAGNSQIPANTVVSNGGLALAPLAVQSPSQAATFPSSPLPVTVEILLNGTWTDVTGLVYQRDGITITGRGRPNEATTAQPAQVELTLNNQDGSFSPQNTASQFYPYLVRNAQIRIGVKNAVTAQGAWYTGYRFWGEVPAWPPRWDPTGTDVYVTLTAVGVLQRMRQSKYNASPLARYYTNIVNAALAPALPGAPLGQGLVPAGYWPCEDGTGSGSFASGIPGGSPMTWTGVPGLASDAVTPTDTGIPGSSPFAQLDSSVWTGTPGAYSSGGVTFGTPGTYTWTCPGGVTSVEAECWGGGGGGSNGNTQTGGAGGEYAQEPAVAVTPGNTYTIVVGAGGSGGAGNTTLDNPGTGGTRSTFTGDTQVVTAHGGEPGPASFTSHAHGGHGSSNTIHHDGGDGAAHTGGASAGSGGGGSGGPGGNGHAGSAASGATPGSGGNAVTGGGPGGAGGKGGSGAFTATPGVTPTPPPGGGGGGGGLRTDTSYGRFGGNGAPGQVTLTFGTSANPPANVIRAVIDVSSTTETIDGTYLLHATTSGTVADLHLTYHTGGNLELIGRDIGQNVLFDSGSKSFGAKGTPMLVSCELTQIDFTGPNPAPPQIKWKLTAITPGATAVIHTYKGTIAGTLGPVTQINVNDAPGHLDTSPTGVGHVAVQYQVDPILNLSPALNAYTGELAGTRFLRLCSEQRVPAAITSGAATDTPAMGPQPAGLLVDLLQDCENTDLGQMFERRDAFGLGYITRVALQNQSPAVVLDYSRAQLAQDIAPTNDDQLTRNDIIATRSAGGTLYETAQYTGPLSVSDPPNGVGLYQYQVTVNVQADSQLQNFAAWLLTLGTLDEFRYPVITIDLSRAEVSDGTFSAMASLDVGGFLQILNGPTWLPLGPINQLAFGFAETLNAYIWTIAVNAVPEDPYTATSFPAW